MMNKILEAGFLDYAMTSPCGSKDSANFPL